MNHHTQTIKVLRIRTVMAKIGISRSTIYDWLNPKSKRYDPTFPKPRQLGKQSVGWLETDLDKWLLQCKIANASTHCVDITRNGFL
ncbi:helix-turn-helix transcriptional regulator [Providencia rettgeri]